jgi:hypothetical protein
MSQMQRVARIFAHVLAQSIVTTVAVLAILLVEWLVHNLAGQTKKLYDLIHLRDIFDVMLLFMSLAYTITVMREIVFGFLKDDLRDDKEKLTRPTGGRDD